MFHLIDEFFKTHYPPSVCTATSTGLVGARTASPTKVAVVPTQTPTDSGYEEATLNRSTAGPIASTSTDMESPTITDETCSTDNGTPAGSTSSSPTQTPRRNVSPPRVTRKHCLYPRRQLMTQRRPSPHHLATKHWGHRQHSTETWMAAPRRG